MKPIKCVAIVLFLLFPISGCAAKPPEKDLEKQIVKLQKRGRNIEAISLFETRQKDIDLTQATLRNIALCYFGEDRYAESLDYAKQALAIDPDDEIAANLFFYNCKVLGEFDQAEPVARRWLESPKAKDTLRHIAIFYTKSGRYQEAIEATRLGISRLPKDDRMAGTHSFLLALVEGAESQQAFVEKWSSRNKPTAYFWEDVGKGLAEIGRHKDAIPFLLKALVLAPSADLASQYISSLRGDGRSEEAVAWAAKWASNGEIDAAFLKMQGAVNFDLKHFDEADRCFHEALTLSPNNATLLVNLLVTMIELERYEEAVEIGRNWLKLHPHFANDRTYFYLADALSWNGQYEEAIENYSTAIGMAPSKSQYIGNLLFAMNQLGQYEEVLAYYTSWSETVKDYSDPHLVKQLEKARAELSAKSDAADNPQSESDEKHSHSSTSDRKKVYLKNADNL